MRSRAPAYGVVVAAPWFRRASPREGRLGEAVGDGSSPVNRRDVVGGSAEVVPDQRLEQGLRLGWHVGVREAARHAPGVGAGGVGGRGLRWRHGVDDSDGPCGAW